MSNAVPIARFLHTVSSLDVDAIAACFAPDATYRNMPDPPRVGREPIRAMFAGVLAGADRVEWEVVSAAYSDDTAWLERVDHFWYDGRRCSIECNGVFRTDPGSGLLVEVRDYLDRATWTARRGSAG